MNDIYECTQCNTEFSDYAELYHPTEHDGGYCPNCYGDTIRAKEQEENEG
jgi:DNA-directed RNA polymerase subunit RPC12/RpoP